MISNELQKIIDMISTQGEMNYAEAATEEQIEAFERKNDINLPKQFREWLLFFGWRRTISSSWSSVLWR